MERLLARAARMPSTADGPISLQQPRGSRSLHTKPVSQATRLAVYLLKINGSLKEAPIGAAVNHVRGSDHMKAVKLLSRQQSNPTCFHKRSAGRGAISITQQPSCMVTGQGSVTRACLTNLQGGHEGQQQHPGTHPSASAGLSVQS